MAIESYFEDIADAIRERGGTSATLTPAGMPQAILDIPGGSSGRLTEIIPLHTNVTTGYITNGSWKYTLEYNNLNTTVFSVSQGTPYILLLGSVAERFRGMFSTTDIALATGDVSGIKVVDKSAAIPYEAVTYTPPSNGFISVYVGDQTNHVYCFEGSLP